MNFSLIGLSNRDKRVYEALVRQPQASVRKLAVATAINRGSVFESIKDLLKAGLITQVKFGKRLAYRAKDPQVLHEILAEKSQQLAEADTQLNSYIDSFAGIANDPSLFHFASFYEGDEGLAAILRDVLKTCRLDQIKEYRVISSPNVSRYLYNNFPYYTRERVKQKISVRVLRQGQEAGEEAPYARSCFIKASATDSNCYTLIYGQKVGIIIVDDFNQTSGLIIDNLAFATNQAMLFDTAWQVALDIKTSI